MKDNPIIASLLRYPIALICAAAIVVLVAVLFLRSSVADELSVLEDENYARIQVIDANAREAKGLEEDVDKVEDFVEQMESRMFDRKARSENTNFFYSFEEDLDVVVTGVRQLPQVPESMVKGAPQELKLHSAIVYELTVEGSYAEILSFMDAAYHVKPIMRISDFKIAKSRQRESGADVLSAAMRVYVMAKEG